jgi:hypothetical protein
MERDIGVGMNESLDCNYIMRFEVSLYFFMLFLSVRYKERFEQDGNVFVVMNYVENGFFCYLLFAFRIRFVLKVLFKII